MGVEQRQFQRRTFSAEERYFIEYKLQGKFFQKHEAALTLNLSAGGLLFKSVKIIPTSTLLDLVLTLPHLKKPLHLKAKVVRTEPTLRENIFSIGLQFMEISDQDRAILNQFCTEKSLAPGNQSVEKKEVSPAKPAGEEAKPLN